MKRLLPGIAVLFILFPLLTQCDVSHKRPGEQAQIPASAQTITISGVTWSDVAFQHEQHSDRYKGMCIKCHDHQPIAGQTHWYCRKCHTAGQDREKLCTAVAQHGCIMTQCDTCHKAQVPPQAPPLAKDCAACHILVPGPTPETPIYTIEDSIASASEVDRWTLPLKTSGTIIIDVEAWESCGAKPIPMDFFGDGQNNNKLHANMYLFNSSGTVVASSTGRYSADAIWLATNRTLPPGNHNTRSGQNPYINVSVPAGTYKLAIGSWPISNSTDAWNGVNNDGSDWTTSYNGTTSYNKYKIKIYFN
jgi:hypothetical protein